MSEPIDQLKVVLKQHNQSLTAARQIVFSALQDQEPQTMRELVMACEGLVNRASIYRVVSLFERLGIVQRLQIGWKYKLELTDTFHHHHHHLTCLRCGKIIPLKEDNQLEDRLEYLAKGSGFTMNGHQLEVQGYCYECSSKS
ncbi:MAG TPA: transcriptional repressor [Methylomirabilota bacterium]|nr:transcriptional repressor [Methylomirabilota bacterium]